jgi:hypothetical protein
MPFRVAGRTAATFLLVLLSLPLAAAAGRRAQSAGELIVREKFDIGQGVPTEGYVSYLVVRRSDSGQVVLRQSQDGPLRTDSVLPRGHYRLRSFIRTCDGNCGLLDSVTNRCAATFRIGAGDLVMAKIARDALGCRIGIAHPS